jgi:hypothetical protein
MNKSNAVEEISIHQGTEMAKSSFSGLMPTTDRMRYFQQAFFLGL